MVGANSWLRAYSNKYGILELADRIIFVFKLIIII